MALRNDYDDLMADIEWEESEVDSGYFNEDDQAGTPMDSWYKITFFPCPSWNFLRKLFYNKH